MTRGPKAGTGRKYDYAEIARVAQIAHARGQSMTEQVAEALGVSFVAARRLISKARKEDPGIPTQLGRNVPLVDRSAITEIILQCAECGWTTDNATAMVWHARSIHNRQATVAERTPKVSL